MQSKAATVEEYLAELPADRRAALSAVRAVILANLDPDLQEGMSYGMIGYAVSRRAYPAGYHCDPKLLLPYAGLAAQKNYNSLYLMATCFGEEGDGGGGGGFAQWFRKRWALSGKKLDMGKGCIRFKKLDDLALDVIGEAIKRASARTFIDYYEEGLAARRDAAKPAASAKAAKKPTANKSTTKKSTTKIAAKKSTAKKSTTKIAAKKSTAKKSTAKKSTAKKSTAKKSTAKKSTAKKSR